MITIKFNTGDTIKATSISEAFDLDTFIPRLSISIEENMLSLEEYAVILSKPNALAKIEATLNETESVIFEGYTTLLSLDKGMTSAGSRIRAVIIK